MSAIGTKRTSLVAPHMSAIGGKADMTFCAAMSAFDPKRTFDDQQYTQQKRKSGLYGTVFPLWEASFFHHRNGFGPR